MIEYLDAKRQGELVGWSQAVIEHIDRAKRYTAWIKEEMEARAKNDIQQEELVFG